MKCTKSKLQIIPKPNHSAANTDNDSDKNMEEFISTCLNSL